MRKRWSERHEYRTKRSHPYEYANSRLENIRFFPEGKLNQNGQEWANFYLEEISECIEHMIRQSKERGINAT